MKAAPVEIEPLLSEKEVAALLSTPKGTLSRWRCERRGPDYVRLSPRKIRYRRDVLLRWLKEREVIIPMRAA